MNTQNPYDQRYAGDSYYWGKKPSSMCDRLIELVQPSPGFRPSLLDLACGEGRNAVHFAARGGVVKVIVAGDRVKLAGQAVTVLRGELV